MEKMHYWVVSNNLHVCSLVRNCFVFLAKVTMATLQKENLFVPVCWRL